VERRQIRRSKNCLAINYNSVIMVALYENVFLFWSWAAEIDPAGWVCSPYIF
jgi:hypothetical protein